MSEVKDSASIQRQRRMGVPNSASSCDSRVDDDHEKKFSELGQVTTPGVPWYLAAQKRVGVTIGILLFAVCVTMFFSRSVEDQSIALTRSEVKCDDNHEQCVHQESTFGLNTVPVGFMTRGPEVDILFHKGGNMYVGRVHQGLPRDQSRFLFFSSDHGTALVKETDLEVFEFFPFLLPNKAPWISLQPHDTYVLPPYRGVLPGYILRDDSFSGARGYRLVQRHNTLELTGPPRIAAYNNLAHDQFYSMQTSSESSFSLPLTCKWHDGSNRRMQKPELYVNTQWVYSDLSKQAIDDIWPEHPFTTQYASQNVLSNKVTVRSERNTADVCIVVPANQVVPGKLLWTELYIKANELDNHMQLVRLCMHADVRMLVDGDYNEMLQTHVYLPLSPIDAQVQDIFTQRPYNTQESSSSSSSSDIEHIVVNKDKLTNTPVAGAYHFHNVHNATLFELKKTRHKHVIVRTHELSSHIEVMNHLQTQLTDQSSSQWTCTVAKCIAPSIAMKEQTSSAILIYDEQYRLLHVLHTTIVEKDLTKSQLPHLFHFEEQLKK